MLIEKTKKRGKYKISKEKKIRKQYRFSSETIMKIAALKDYYNLKNNTAVIELAVQKFDIII